MREGARREEFRIRIALSIDTFRRPISSAPNDDCTALSPLPPVTRDASPVTRPRIDRTVRPRESSQDLSRMTRQGPKRVFEDRLGLTGGGIGAWRRGGRRVWATVTGAGAFDAQSDGIDDGTCERRRRSDSSQSISISIWQPVCIL